MLALVSLRCAAQNRTCCLPECTCARLGPCKGANATSYGVDRHPVPLIPVSSQTERSLCLPDDASLSLHQAKRARQLSESGAPSGNDIATFNIILFVSIALVLCTYFGMMAMVDMDLGNDSLLYAKSKSD